MAGIVNQGSHDRTGVIGDAGNDYRVIGRRIRVEGAPAAEQFGFVMVGPIFDVSRVTLID